MMSAAFLVSEQNRYHLLPASELSCAKNTATSMLRPLGPRNRSRRCPNTITEPYLPEQACVSAWRFCFGSSRVAADFARTGDRNRRRRRGCAARFACPQPRPDPDRQHCPVCLLACCGDSGFLADAWNRAPPSGYRAIFCPGHGRRADRRAAGYPVRVGKCRR